MPDEPPPFWGRDELSSFLETAKQVQWETFARKRSEFLDIAQIHRLYLRFLDGAVNPKPLLPIEFFYRSHSAFLSAASLALAGSTYETYAVLRSALENAGYGHYIGDDQDRWDTWTNRHEDDQSKAAVRSQFSYGKIRSHLVGTAPTLGKLYSHFCELLIDYGAHPNERGHSINRTMQEDENGDHHWNTVYLQQGGVAMDLALRTLAQVGILGLRLAQDLFPLRFRALGLTYDIDIISKRF